MPRGARTDFPGAFHHVYARGIEKREIFGDDRDREELLRRVRLNLPRFRATCLAWAFMPNHFHLLFHSEEGVLARFMGCLLTGYSGYFNRRHGRAGHLFQNRYRSRIVRSDPYLAEAIRYIHLNPLRAGIVSSLDELASYRWTGHGEIVTTGRAPWDRYPFVRGFFEGQSGHAGGTAGAYLEFLRDGLESEPVVRPPVSDPSVDLWPAEDAEDDVSWERGSGTIGRLEDAVLSVRGGKRNLSDSRRGGKGNRALARWRRDVLVECVLHRGFSRRMVCAFLGITLPAASYLLKADPPKDSPAAPG